MTDPRTTPTLPPPAFPVAWSFQYDGPIHPVDDRSCDLCNAVGAKRCPKNPAQHGSNPNGCSTCLAVRIGYCNNHCGIERALREHNDDEDHVIETGHQPTFDLTALAVLSYVGTLSKDAKTVVVKALAHQDQPDAPYAGIQISVTVRK